ncbi:MAG: efflux RND transporter periplasmic adaptor subunit [Bacteroidetes bacterium HGW-Bacteroidetes-17]|nr:MAG: efflux RND transporter periplasmic adaptor subunit [Bacteroidetes bacterium HGW-Bacteroidetes-17]
MKTIIKIIKENLKLFLAVLLIAMVLGYFIGKSTNHPNITLAEQGESTHQHIDESINQIWTCAMHPQIRMDKPGACPICGMDLIPLKNSNVEIDDQAIEMSESAMKLAEVQTSIVSRGQASKEVLLYGKIQIDERLKQSQTAHVPGRIEKLLINVTGEQVKKGQLIARIYSPELVTAQKELIEALSLKDKYPALIEAAREKLRNWKLSKDQISELEKSGIVSSTFEIFANTSGIVVSRKVNEGDYINIGAVLFDVADLSKVWGIFDAYESDLNWISPNQNVEFTSQVIPGKTFTGKITFIDPIINATTRTAGIRIEMNNSEMLLKPEMFINGIIHSTLKGNADQLTIPQTAVLWTGTRSVVYVKIPETEHASFKLREITLGAAMKDTYVVLEGLAEGEEIVTNGTFSVDAAAQLAGKTSMMNPTGEAGSTPHDMSKMNAGSEKQTEQSKPKMDMNPKPMNVPSGFKSQIGEVVKSYLTLKDAFVATDEKLAVASAKLTIEQLGKVDMSLLKGDSHNLWMKEMESMEENLKGIISMQGIEMKRSHFELVSDHLTIAIKSFGFVLKNKSTIYIQFCPMAFDNKGAFWLSADEEINNPYFGDAMLRCGETKEVIKSE